LSGSGTSKQALRESMLAARRALPPDARAALSRRIAESVLALDLFARAATIALYAPMGAEVDTGDIARAALAAGKRVAFPRIDETRRALTFASCSAADLLPAARGTLAPPESAPAVPLAGIDLVLVPGVAFDVRCRRLGRGRGHYDATLAQRSAQTAAVGLAFELQVVQAVPEEAHDAMLDALVTEARVLFRLPDAPPPAKS
jgi:5-formyltetrahydrofolate cyclo-ligase